MKDKVKWFVILHIIIAIIAASGIVSKSAGFYPLFSIQWIERYAVVFCVLAFYAIAWQQVIKHLPLIVAYANKAVTTIWGMIWGFLIFHEKITPLKVLGAAIVILGVYLVVSGDEDNSNNDQEVK